MLPISVLAINCLLALWVSLAAAQSTQVVPRAWYHKSATTCPTDATIALIAQLDERCLDIGTGQEWRCARPETTAAANRCNVSGEWDSIGPGGTGNATQLQGRAIDTDAPADGALLGWNQAANEWQAMATTDFVRLTGAQTLSDKKINNGVLNTTTGNSTAYTINDAAYMTINPANGRIEYGAGYYPIAPILWTPNSVEVDGTGCTAPIAEVVNGSEPLRNFACADGGKFSGQLVLPIAYSNGEPLNFHLKMRTIGTSSVPVAFDIQGWCRSVNEAIDGTYSTAPANCDTTTGGTANLIKTCNTDFVPDGPCAGGDVMSWRAVVDSGNSNAGPLTVKFLGGFINYSKRRDREQ